MTDQYGYTCRGGRKNNEDAYGIFTYGENLCAAVADGLGGHGDGGQASRLAVQCFSACGASGEFPSEAEICGYFEKANREILARRRDEDHMKTTAVWLCIHGGQAVWAHIGDSRLYHFRDGKLLDYTLDHSVSQMAVAMGKISRQEISGHRDRSRLLRVLGEEEIQPELHSSICLEQGRHAFLLCTDGFWESVTEEEIQWDLQKAVSSREWLEALRYRILGRQRENYDNYTAVGIFAER